MSVNKTVGTFVPSEMTVVISHNGTNTAFVLEGYGTDTMISIERGEAKWESTIGVDGMHQRTHRKNNTYTATVSLLQVSASNDFLTGLVRFDEQDLRGGGLFTCTITDKSGRSYIYSDQTYVIEPSTYDYGQAASTRDWILVMPYAEAHLGGNAKLPQAHIEILAKLGIIIDESWSN